MNIFLKNTIITLFILLLCLPFVLLNDIFPFSRFGMFAEPVRIVPKENFIVYATDKNLKRKVWNYKEAAFANDPTYLFRNYFYRNQSRLLLQRLHQSQSESAKKWELYRITASDTTLIAVYEP
jgi:hypothetical protein